MILFSLFRKEEKSNNKFGYRLSDLSKSYERHGERSPLMANMNGKVTENGHYYKTVKMDSTSRNNTKQVNNHVHDKNVHMVALDAVMLYV